MQSYAWEGSLTDVVPVGLTPTGLRLDVLFTGTITEGELEGAQMQGVDYLLIRPDGVAVIDARETIRSTHGAGATHARAMGYIVPPFDMPPLEALLDPQFEWPDVDLPMHGAVTLESGQKGSPMNSTVYAFTGQVNLAKGQLGIAARAIG